MRRGFYSGRRAAHLVAVAAPTPGTRRARPFRPSFIPRSISLFFFFSSFLLPLFSSHLFPPTHTYHYYYYYYHHHHPVHFLSLISTQPAAFVYVCLFFSLKYPPSFLCLLAIIDIPPPSDPFRSRFLVSQVPALTPLGNETATTSSLPPSVSRYLVLSTRLHSFPITIRTVSP